MRASGKIVYFRRERTEPEYQELIEFSEVNGVDFVQSVGFFLQELIKLILFNNYGFEFLMAIFIESSCMYCFFCVEGWNL